MTILLYSLANDTQQTLARLLKKFAGFIASKFQNALINNFSC